MTARAAAGPTTWGRLPDDELDSRSRALFRDADAVVAVVFLSPEAGEPPLGLTPPEYYVVSRGAPLGAVRGSVVASVFGLIEPSLTATVWNGAMARLDADEVIASKVAMAETVLARIAASAELPPPERATAELQAAVERTDVDGHPLFAAIRELEPPTTSSGGLWRLCELVREHRGSSHICAYRAAGLSAAEVNVLTELWRDMPVGSESTTVNAWSRGSVEAALATLGERGLAEGRSITEEGRALRDAVETATSLGERSLVEAVADFDAVAAVVSAWGAAVRAALRPPYWWHTWRPARS